MGRRRRGGGGQGFIDKLHLTEGGRKGIAWIRRRRRRRRRRKVY